MEVWEAGKKCVSICKLVLQKCRVLEKVIHLTVIQVLALQKGALPMWRLPFIVP